jgi:ribonucleoside-diphosphate reductase alpha subunit
MAQQIYNNKIMKVIKRDGTHEDVSFDKVIRRIKLLCDGIIKQGMEPTHNALQIDPIKIAQKVINEIRDGITTTELDEFAARTSASMLLEHPDYGVLAGRIIISNHHKNTFVSFSDTMRFLYEKKDYHNKSTPLIDRSTYKVIMNNRDKLDNIIDYSKDYNIDYFGFKTLEKSYLIKYTTGQIRVMERPQHMWMRVAIGIHGNDIDAAIETYQHMADGNFIHATPTLFNAGTPRPQLSSCFLMGIEDSIEGIYKCLSDCAKISKWAGGLGIHISNIRASQSIIRGTNGVSNGIVPMLKVFNETARYVDQGGGKRMGSIAIYIEPWHAEFLSFLELKKGKGNENEKARDLFYAVYMNDLFMKRLEQALLPNAPKVYWTLMCPDECPGLCDVYGDEFVKLYTKYETEGKGREKVNILKIWSSILASQKETGTPYILFKDHINNKSNQKNIGVIKSSNLCTEITEYSDTNEYAVCNLASVGLPKHIKSIDGKLQFNHEQLFNSVKIMTKNLNKIIDINYYPVPETQKSNMKHRPMGLGVQGLADVFQILRYPFDSPEAYKLNQEIFETIYFGALTASNELAAIHGPYETYQGSPASQGLLQFDLWKLNGHIDELPLSGRWNWDNLRNKIAKTGLRNSLLVAPMPTASTAQILGNNECFEPYTYNIYVRKVLAGDFTIINKHLHKDLCDRGIWSEQMKRELIKQRGSVQNIPEIPNDLKELYKTSFEIKQKVLIDMSAGRGCFIDQSQSLNLFLDDPNDNKLTAMHLYSWKKGLKTGIYYLRRESISKAQQFTVGPSAKRRESSETIPTITKTSNVDIPEDPTLDVKLCLISDPDCLACQ